MPLRASCHLRRIGADHHAFGHRQRAGHLQLRHLLHFHQAHAAGGLQRQAFVIAERRNLDARLLGGVDHQRARRGRRPLVPSIVRFTGSAMMTSVSQSRAVQAIASSDACSIGARLAVQMLFELFAELFDDRNGRHGGRVAQRAERAAQHVLRQCRRAARCRSAVPPPSWKRVRILRQPGGAFAARDAPAAAFVRVKPHDAQRGLHHAGVFVHDHHAARAEHALRAWPANRNPWGCRTRRPSAAGRTSRPESPPSASCRCACRRPLRRSCCSTGKPSGSS